MSAESIAKEAKAAFEASQLIDASERGKALSFIKDELELRKDDIRRANEIDMSRSAIGAKGLS